MKVFNTTAVCIPTKHSMVDLSERVEEIRKLVDSGKYFTINRARQYGKTTTLSALEKPLLKDYLVLSLDFQGIGAGTFENEGTFSQAMVRLIIDLHEFEDVSIPDKTLDALEKLNDLETVSVKWLVLMRASNNKLRKLDSDGAYSIWGLPSSEFFV